MAIGNRRSGFTLVEVMLAAMVLAIGVIGTSGYRVQASMNARKADLEMTAARMGLRLVQEWRAQGGVSTYDPVTSVVIPGVTVAQVQSSGLSLPAGFDTVLGHYSITMDNVTYRTMLSSRAAVAGVTPKVLSVQIGWRLDRQNVNLSSTDKVIPFAVFLDN